jgi:ABC-type phosphate/phosphonate transport system ATPase subunit
MDEVSAAFGLFGREDSLRVVNDVLVGGGSVVAIGDPGAGKSSLLRVAPLNWPRSASEGCFLSLRPSSTRDCRLRGSPN